MPLTIEDKGRRNRVEVSQATLEKLNGVLRITGDDNIVRIGEGCASQSIDFELRDGVEVTIGEGCRLAALRVFALASTRVQIGKGCIFNGRTRVLLHEPASVFIGERCLLGGDCTITVSDMHSILDAATGQRINPACDVVIGDHVWLGESVQVLKGAEISTNCVIGARALVTGAIPAGSLAVGVPARVVREGVTWDNRLL